MEYIINKEFENKRLDVVIPLLNNEISRSKVQTLIDNDDVSVNGKKQKASYKVKENDVIEVNYEIIPLNFEPENIPLDIVYEDDDVVVINKPQGMVVHPSNGHYSGTLVNGLLYHFKQLSNIDSIRPGIVHRIDKDTSGLIMVAKNDLAHEFLANQLKDKTAYRQYIALVRGEVNVNKGKIDAPIGRSFKDRKLMAIVNDGKPSVTHFEVIKRFNGYTLISCLLETGRTHQIRVHMAYIGYPIVGDTSYGSKNTYGLNGQLLHATKLSFIHPKTKERITVEAPLPQYFNDVLNNLETKGVIK
ncbi:MAG: RluA family pseudouridine synthase [Bacilli bacterium]|nr:RluA family pseudouridine synthase [Bacilli bacterium]